jgi:hypothetical protein
VLAAVERRGSATGLDLWADFPSLNQSTLVRVAERLVELGHLSSEGDLAGRLIGQVRYFPASRCRPLPPVLEELAGYARKTLQLRAWRQGDELRIGLPLSEIARDLSGRPYSALALIAPGGVKGTIDLLRSRLSALSTEGAVNVEVAGSKIQDDPPVLVVRVSASLPPPVHDKS